MCVCRGLWGVGGGGGGDGGGVGEGGEEVNTRSGMTQLCGGLVCNTHSCVFVCVCVCVRAHAPVTASPIFSNQREKQKKLFCLIIHSHSHRRFSFAPRVLLLLLPASCFSVQDLFFFFDLSSFTCWVLPMNTIKLDLDRCCYI